MIIWMQDETNEEPILKSGQEKLLEQAALLCLEKEGLSASDAESMAVEITFVSEEEIRQMNRDFRDVDKVTDVLSFPMMNGMEEIRQAVEGPEVPLGDVVICREKIRKQAEEYGHSETRELVYLFVHSMLHLLGYDHMEEEERRIMRAREEEIMEELQIGR